MTWALPHPHTHAHAQSKVDNGRNEVRYWEKSTVAAVIGNETTHLSTAWKAGEFSQLVCFWIQLHGNHCSL